MDRNNTALEEFVRGAQVASKGDPDLLRTLAQALWRAAEELSDQAEPAGSPAAPEETDARPDTGGYKLPDDTTLALRLAERQDAPHALIQKVASGPIDSARTLLEKSPVLSQDDLIDILIRCSRDHVLSIAGRWDVGPQLADALSAYGNEQVLQQLLANTNAKLAAKTLCGLGRRATQSVQTQNALLARDDLPVELVADLMECVLGDARDLLLKKLVRVDPVDSAQTIRIPKKTRQSRKFIDALHLADSLAKRRGTDESVLAELAAQKNHLALLICCSKFFRVDLDTTLGILMDKTGLSFATFCRAKNLNVQLFSQIMVVPNLSAPQDSTAILGLINFYRRLPLQDAIKAIALWRRDYDLATKAVEAMSSSEESGDEV